VQTPCKRSISLEQREIFNNFIMRKGNLVIFITQQGKPVIREHICLRKKGDYREDIIPDAENQRQNRYIIVLIIEKHMSEAMSRQI